MEIFANGNWLPLAFAALMGLAILVYAVLDGYDLGVGILMGLAEPDEKDRMIASIGPFWDANETWLVLGVGLLLVAFPAAHGIVLGHLYLPTALMLIGLIVRGVAFDFRMKAKDSHKRTWNRAFCAGSLLASLTQGYMLGQYILGFDTSAGGLAFSALVGVSVAAGYSLVGAAWLILKTEAALQQKAVRWARLGLIGTVIGIALVSVATPLASARIFGNWFSFPAVLYLAPIPLVTGVLILALWRILNRLPLPGDRLCWTPFALTVGIFVLCFAGLAYSFYPYIVPDQLTIAQAASAPESLLIMLVGALLVLPFLIGYTIFSYRVFHGKASDISYH